MKKIILFTAILILSLSIVNACENGTTNTSFQLKQPTINNNQTVNLVNFNGCCSEHQCYYNNECYDSGYILEKFSNIICNDDFWYKCNEYNKNSTITINSTIIQCNEKKEWLNLTKTNSYQNTNNNSNLTKTNSYQNTNNNSIWVRQDIDSKTKINGIEHKIKLFDVNKNSTKCRINVDGSIKWINVNSSETINNVKIKVMDALYVNTTTTKNNLCQIQLISNQKINHAPTLANTQTIELKAISDARQHKTIVDNLNYLKVYSNIDSAYILFDKNKLPQNIISADLVLTVKKYNAYNGELALTSTNKILSENELNTYQGILGYKLNPLIGFYPGKTRVGDKVIIKNVQTRINDNLAFNLWSNIEGTKYNYEFYGTENKEFAPVLKIKYSLNNYKPKIFYPTIAATYKTQSVAGMFGSGYNDIIDSYSLIDDSSKKTKIILNFDIPKNIKINSATLNLYSSVSNKNGIHLSIAESEKFQTEIGAEFKETSNIIKYDKTTLTTGEKLSIDVTDILSKGQLSIKTQNNIESRYKFYDVGTEFSPTLTISYDSSNSQKTQIIQEPLNCFFTINYVNIKMTKNKIAHLNYNGKNTDLKIIDINQKNNKCTVTSNGEYKIISMNNPEKINGLNIKLINIKPAKPNYDEINYGFGFSPKIIIKESKLQNKEIVSSKKQTCITELEKYGYLKLVQLKPKWWVENCKNYKYTNAEKTTGYSKETCNYYMKKLSAPSLLNKEKILNKCKGYY